jgi:hypothetical protein
VVKEREAGNTVAQKRRDACSFPSLKRGSLQTFPEASVRPILKGDDHARKRDEKAAAKVGGGESAWGREMQ